MLGNLAEWVADDFHPDDTGAPASSDPWRGTTRPDHRLSRGGGWLNLRSECRCARRVLQTGDFLSFTDVGLRVALDWKPRRLAEFIDEGS
jgi:formylglycine-generating enzyme required for sulfatase activity